jgi:hypothetical protein
MTIEPRTTKTKECGPLSWLSDIRATLRRKTLARKSPAEVFRCYYKSNKWGSLESRSGKGSSLAATETLRALLPQVIAELGATTIVDVPCGDFNWMQHVDLCGVTYIGGDIVPDMIAQNGKRFAKPGVRFEVIDLITGPVPKADLLFVRDCLVHLSNKHLRRALQSIRLSGSEWLLTTTFPGITSIDDISTGQWRKIDLTLAPFHLPPPYKLMFEGSETVRGQKPDKMLGLWRITDIPDFSGDGPLV